MGTDEGEFNRILSSYSYPMLRCVFDEYKKIKGKSFGDALDSELSGDLKIGMKAVCKYFSYLLSSSVKIGMEAICWNFSYLLSFLTKDLHEGTSHIYSHL